MNIRDVLTGIYQSHGGLTPEIVVDEARPEDSPLHSRFEWDDDIAAEKYRRVQAAHIIRSVHVQYEGSKGSTSIRGFIAVRNIDDDTSTVFKPVVEVLENPDSKRLVLNEMHRDWNTFRDKYQHFEEYAQLIEGEAGRLMEAAA